MTSLEEGVFRLLQGRLRTVSFEESLHRVHELGERKRFGEGGMSAESPSGGKVRGRRYQSTARNGDDLDRGMVCAEMPDQAQPVQVLHDEVRDDEIQSGDVDQLEGLTTSISYLNGESGQLEELLQGVSKIEVVLDDEDGAQESRLQREAASLLSRCAGRGEPVKKSRLSGQQEGLGLKRAGHALRVLDRFSVGCACQIGSS